MALIGSWVKLMEGVCRQIIPGTIGLIEDPLREEGRQSRLPPWTSGISRSAHEKKSTAQAADAALLGLFRVFDGGLGHRPRRGNQDCLGVGRS